MLEAPVQKYKFILMLQDAAPALAFFLKKREWLLSNPAVKSGVLGIFRDGTA